MGIGPRAQPPTAKRAGRLWGQKCGRSGKFLESSWSSLKFLDYFALLYLKRWVQLRDYIFTSYHTAVQIFHPRLP